MPPVDVVEDAPGWRLVFEIPGAEPRPDHREHPGARPHAPGRPARDGARGRTLPARRAGGRRLRARPRAARGARPGAHARDVHGRAARSSRCRRRRRPGAVRFRSSRERRAHERRNASRRKGRHPRHPSGPPAEGRRPLPLRHRAAFGVAREVDLRGRRRARRAARAPPRRPEGLLRRGAEAGRSLHDRDGRRRHAHAQAARRPHPAPRAGARARQDRLVPRGVAVPAREGHAHRRARGTARRTPRRSRRSPAA